MANEIWHSADESYTLYALIWRQTDDRVYDAVAGSNTFDVYTDADIDDYDVLLTAQGVGADSDYHSVDFPSDIAAGIYRVQIMRQVGGTIDADADIAVAHGEIYWSGSAEINPYTLDALIDIAQADLDIITGTNGVLIDDDAITSAKYDETTAFPIQSVDSGATEIARTGADGDTLETLSDQLDTIETNTETIIANTGKVVNVYPTGERRVITGGANVGVEDEKE